MVKVDSKQLSLTKAQITRATNICSQVRELLKAKKPDEDLTKTDPEEEFFNNPQEAVLSEEAINTAPDAFIALAAFVAQSVEGLQNAFKVLNQKVDAILNNQAETNEVVLKAQDATLDLLKTELETAPVTQFKSPVAFVQGNLEKAQDSKPPKSYVISALEKMVEEGKAYAQDVSRFEVGGHIRPELMEAIMASWKSDKVLQ